jgi:hypothetical protein
MITDEQARRIALFFLFSLVDEKVALQAAHKAAAQVKALSTPKPGSGPTPPDNSPQASNAAIIAILRKGFDQHRKLLPRNRPMIEPDSSWVLPTHAGKASDLKYIDIQGWFRFQKDSSYTEIVAVVLAKILGFDEYDIAEGLNISIGTVRYRIGKGVRQLGLHFVKVSSSAQGKV